MSIGDQIGVDHIDREADWPHILYKQTRFYNVALCVANMRWGRRCWDCSDRRAVVASGQTDSHRSRLLPYG